MISQIFDPENLEYPAKIHDLLRLVLTNFTVGIEVKDVKKLVKSENRNHGGVGILVGRIRTFRLFRFRLRL